MTLDMQQNTPLDEDFRKVGFTSTARNFPMDDFVLELFAAFNNVESEQLSPAQKFHPNSSSKEAWTRVAEKAKELLIGEDIE